VVVSTAAVVVSMGEVSLVAVSAAVAFVVAVSMGDLVSMGDVSAVAVSTAVAFVVGVLGAATSVAIFAITDFLMMSSSAASAFRGGAGAIRTDITVTTRTITMDTATMGTADTGTTVAPGMVTTVAPVMDIATAAEPVMDTAMAAEPVMDTAMAADQGVCGGGDKRAPRAFRIRLVARAF
jgi:hypothetical protein